MVRCAGGLTIVRHISLIILGIFALASIVNSSVLFSGPFWDDYEFIFSNKAIVSGTNPFVFWIKGSGYERVWSLGYTQFWLLVKMFGHEFWAYKLVSLFFHSINTYLVYLLARRWIGTSAHWVSLIFLFHPFHVETLSWIFQLNTIMGFFWAMLATLTLSSVIARELTNKQRILRVLLFVLFYYFSLKTKPVAVLIPFAALLEFKWEEHRKYLLSTLSILSLLLLIAVLITLNTNNAITNSIYENSIRKTYFFNEMFGRIAFGPEVTSIDGNLAYHTFFGKQLLKLHLMSRNFLFYFSKFLIPVNFLFMYPTWSLSSSVGALSVSLFGLFGAWTFFGFHYLGSKKMIPSFIVLAGFLPISGILYVPYMKYSSVSDHWAYVLVFGWSLLFVQLFDYLAGKFKIKSFQSILVIFVFVLGFQQARYSRHFNSTDVMLEANIAANPNASFLYEYLARVYQAKKNPRAAYDTVMRGLKAAPNSEQLNKIKKEIEDNNR